MNPEERMRLERMLAEAVEPPPADLKDRVFEEPRDPVAPLSSGDVRSAADRFRWIGVAAAAALFSVTLWSVLREGGSGASPIRPQEMDIPGLVQRLGSEEAAEREAAETELQKRGETARPSLERVLNCPNPEVRLRARKLVTGLNRSLIEKHAGRFGETGVFWVDHHVYPLVANEENLPDWMRPALVEGNPAMVLATMKDGIVVDTDLVLLKIGKEWRGNCETGVEEIVQKSALQHWWGFEKNSQGASISSGVECGLGAWWKESRKSQGTELFRLWSRLRETTIVFVTEADRYGAPGLREGLKEALVHECRDHRAMAAHALRHYYQADAVEAALSALSDEDPLVRDSARGTLKELVDAPDLGCAELPVWWESLDRTARGERYQQQWMKELKEGFAKAGNCRCNQGGAK